MKLDISDVAETSNFDYFNVDIEACIALARDLKNHINFGVFSDTPDFAFECLEELVNNLCPGEITYYDERNELDEFGDE